MTSIIEKNKVNELTEEQRVLMSEIKQEYMDLALHSGKYPEESDIKLGIYKLYKLAVPDVFNRPTIYVFDSYTKMQETYNQHLKERIIGNQKNEAIMDEIWDSQWDNPVLKILYKEISSDLNRDMFNKIAWDIGNIVSIDVNDEIILSVAEDLKKRGLQPIDHFIGLGNWSGWLAYHDFIFRSGLVKDKIKDYKKEISEFEDFRDLLRKGIWTIVFFKHAVYICALPTKIHLNEKGELHHDKEPAVQWRDGTGQWFNNGQFIK